MTKRNCIVMAMLLGILARAQQNPVTADLPAPAVDRVGYPKDYREAFIQIRVSDRADTKTTAVIYANLPGSAVKPQAKGTYPYGAVLVNETWSTLQDAQGNVLLDKRGHFRQDNLLRVHVMRKDHEFGEAYKQNRSGEWEYVSFAPDGSYLTPPAKSGACAQCHMLYAGKAKDWVFGAYEKH
jgi:hypothetical protein